MLTIIARPTVDPTQLEKVKAAMLELVKQSRQEEGCLFYELHQDKQQSNRFVFVETWQNKALWKQHMEGEAIRTFNEKISGAIIGFELQEMTKIA